MGISSVEKLSEKAELPYPTVRDIVSGKHEGGYDKRLKLARALNCSVADFYKGDSSAAAIPDFSGALTFLSLFENLPPERKALVSMLVFDDAAYLSDNPDLARAVATLLKFEGPKK